MKEKVYYIDVLNVVSALAVVFLHANGIFWAHPSGSTWINSNIIETAFYFAVPVFFMISGCTLVEYRERYSTKEFFNKRIRRIVVPYVFWSVVAVCYCYIFKRTSFSWSAADVVAGVLENRFMGIYWFFMPLFAVYLSMPVLTEIRNKIQAFSYMIVYAIISISLISFLKQFGVVYFPSCLVVPVCGGFLLYVCLGYVLHRIEIPRRCRFVIYAMGLICAICHCCFTIVLSPEGGGICRLFKGYLLLPNVMYAVSVFVFFKYNADKLLGGDRTVKLVRFIKPATFGVYLIHLYFHYFAQKCGVDIFSIVYRTVGALGIFAASVITVLIIRKTRIGRIICP